MGKADLVAGGSARASFSGSSGWRRNGSNGRGVMIRQHIGIAAGHTVETVCKKCYHFADVWELILV